MFVSSETPTLDDIVNYYGSSPAEMFGDYPIWDTSKRDWLNSRIYDHFRFRKVAQETPAMFMFYAQRKMREIMPTFNPMFKALENARADISSWSESRTLASATPQTQLSGAENYADALQDVRAESGQNTAQALSEWYSGLNNALMLLFTELEPLFTQIWGDDE